MADERQARAGDAEPEDREHDDSPDGGLFLKQNRREVSYAYACALRSKAQRKEKGEFVSLSLTGPPRPRLVLEVPRVRVPHAQAPHRVAVAPPSACGD